MPDPDEVREAEWARVKELFYSYWPDNRPRNLVPDMDDAEGPEIAALTHSFPDRLADAEARIDRVLARLEVV